MNRWMSAIVLSAMASASLRPGALHRTRVPRIPPRRVLHADPNQPAGTHSAPFNPNFLSMLRKLRGERLTAFNAFRKASDPSNLFYNNFLRQLLEG